MSVLTVLQAASAIFGGLAAILWLIAAQVVIPTKYVLDGVFLGGPDRPGEKRRLDPIVVALRKQSRWSAAAATCAAIASAMQAAALL